MKTYEEDHLLNEDLYEDPEIIILKSIITIIQLLIGFTAVIIWYYNIYPVQDSFLRVVYTVFIASITYEILHCLQKVKK